MAPGRRVLITGATSGIGREMAVQLGRLGARVAITGRREAKLRETCHAVEAAGGEGLALLGSVTDTADVKRQYTAIRDKWGGLDWAILNAGVSDSMNAREFKAEHYHWMFETNVRGVVNWLEAVIPDMVAAGRGTIVGMASLAAFRGLPKTGAYCASKAALFTLLESTRVDLRGTGVNIVTICPGFIKSELTARNDPREMAFLMEPEDAVRRILRGIERNQRIVHFPWQISYLMKYIVHNMPAWLYDRVAAKASRSSGPSASRSGSHSSSRQTS
jgi:short-subunit dehydrogenase